MPAEEDEALRLLASLGVTEEASPTGGEGTTGTVIDLPADESNVATPNDETTGEKDEEEPV
jgi:hypothetical protein